MEMLLIKTAIFSYLFCGFRRKQSGRDDIRKTITSIFLTMVEEKSPLHGGVNGLIFQTLIINYEITGAIFSRSNYLLVNFTQVVINVSFCAVSVE